MARPKPPARLKGRGLAAARAAEAAERQARSRRLDHMVERALQALDEAGFGHEADRPCSAKYRALAGLPPPFPPPRAG
ncbi:MAG TPA: hypothetical protein VF559_07330 [Caulobacteraceae bacterium]|jgi:hypothetical protein